jgi:hypothetical protein
MDPFVIGVPLYFAAHFGLTPLIGLSSKKIRPQVEQEAIEPEEFPAQLAVYFEAQASALEPLGFHRVAYFRMPKSGPGHNYCILMLNRETGDSAMVSAIMEVAGGVERVSTQYLEFSTRYPDGRLFDTLNSSSLSIFARVASETKTRVPSVTDPRQLYALHRFVIARANVAGRPVTFDQSTAADHLNAERRETLTAQVRSGRFYWNTADDTYRRTLKGAYLMTWSLMWPISIFRRRAMERRAGQILREFRAVFPVAA